MKADEFEELFAIIRQHELHIRTLQMLLEIMTARLMQPYIDIMDGAAASEKKLFGRIDEAVASSTSDHQLGTAMRASMSEIILDFFQNVRRLALPPETDTK